MSALRRLRGRSAAELAHRARCELVILAERSGLSPDVGEPRPEHFLARGLDPALPPETRSAEALLAAFRAGSGSRPRFFAGVEAPARTGAALAARHPAAAAALATRAERIVAGRFDLLGEAGLDFGDPVEWSLDPVLGVRAPALHWSRIRYLDPRRVGDHKRVWELNRHPHFVTLGRAYALTGDERYARCFAERLAGWMDANPPKVGINWASSLELALRAVAWTWALHLFRASPALTPALHLRALAFLRLQARHVERNLSTWFSPNTHLTGEALGLFVVGSAFPELREAPRWRRTGRRVLESQLRRQVLPDGTYFERSTAYARYTADFALHLALLGDATGAPLRGEPRRALRRLLDHLLHLARPDGRWPLLGDDDGGRLLPLDERPADDFRATFATAAVVFDDPAYRFVGGDAEEAAIWLLGAEGARRLDAIFPAPPAAGSRGFAAGGVWVMRSGWGAEADWLVADCGPHGAPGGGHAHAAALSVEIAARGRPLVVDPGTFTYTGPERDRFRGTAAHSTLTVDDAPSAIPGAPFQWRTTARGRAHRWVTHPRFDLFEGEHDGFLRLPAPATHRRGILFLKGDYWILRDRVLSLAPHRVRLRFQLAPGVTLTPRPGGANADGVELACFGPELRVVPEAGEVSRVHGARAPAPGLTLHAGTAPGEDALTTFLLPGGGDARREPARLGEAFRVTRGADADLAAFSVDGSGVEAGGVRADFDWLWLRRDAATGELREAVAAGGSRLEVDGVEVFRATAPTGWVALRFTGNRPEAETDAAASFSLRAPSRRSAAVGG